MKMAGGVEEDAWEAAKWYREAAEQGDSEAQNYLAVCYENGYGVEQNIDKAIEWYRKASNNGCEEAKEALDELLKRRQ